MKLMKIRIASETSDFTIVAELEPADLFRLTDVLEDAAIAAENFGKLERAVKLREKIAKLYADASKVYSEISKAVADGNVKSRSGEWNAIED